MYSWFKTEILAMSGSDYVALLSLLLFSFAYLLYYSYRTFRRFRFIDGTATSKIRSAAQGMVELKGLGEWLPGGSISSPFSKSRCIWYHCTIDKRSRSGKRTSWTNISDECSENLFCLVDDTGSCIIDPDHAHVIPESDITWYGHNPGNRDQAPEKAKWVNLSMGNYRFRERLIRPATTLYALGRFRTLRSNPSEESTVEQVEELVKQWKRQPHRYLTGFDLDRNGKIQQQEWKTVRAAARKQVLAKINKEKSEHHVLSRGEDDSHPYILSATLEEDMVARKKVGAHAAVTCAFMIFAAMVVMYSLRPPFQV